MRIGKIVDSHYEKYKDIAKKEFVKYLENKDLELFKAKPKYLVVKDKRKRTIWTPRTGRITFVRRRYINIRNQKYICLIDRELDIDKYKLVSKEFRKLAFQHFTQLKSYRQIANLIFMNELSKMSIHNFIKEADHKYEIKEHQACDQGILWINCDSLWIKENKVKNSIDIKNFIFFTGRDTHLHRHKLMGKNMKHIISSDIDKIGKEIIKIINTYDNVREVHLIGDGAPWIKKVARLTGAKFFIDKFHYYRAINNLVRRNYKLKTKILKLINLNLSKKEFKFRLMCYVADCQYGEITKGQLKLIGYLSSNYHIYIESRKSGEEINCIEAFQAHYQANYFKNQRKGWSVRVINNLITHINSTINHSTTI